MFNGDDLATLCENLVKFGQVTPELEGRQRIPVVDQQFSNVRLAAPLLDTAGISTEFVGRSVLSFASPIH